MVQPFLLKRLSALGVKNLLFNTLTTTHCCQAGRTDKGRGTDTPKALAFSLPALGVPWAQRYAPPPHQRLWGKITFLHRFPAFFSAGCGTQPHLLHRRLPIPVGSRLPAPGFRLPSPGSQLPAPGSSLVAHRWRSLEAAGKGWALCRASGKSSVGEWGLLATFIKPSGRSL